MEENRFSKKLEYRGKNSEYEKWSNALWEENYNVGEFKSKVYIPENNRVVQQFNAKYFTIRLELDGYINNLGMHNTYLGVYQIPKEITLSSDGLKMLNEY